jgi:DNA-directed RNA polymerase specialized sigma24 family protein
VPDSTPPRPSPFEQTQWSRVLPAGAANAPGADAALAELCLTYWYPLHAFVRRRGSAHHDAEDLTQAFFGKLLEKNYLGDASRERGRFLTFLLASLQHFLANEWDQRRAKKRGGGSTGSTGQEVYSGLPLGSGFSPLIIRTACRTRR